MVTPSANAKIVRNSGQADANKGQISGTVSDTRQGRILVEGVGMIKRHTRPNPGKQIKGGIAEKEGLIAISNVMIVTSGGVATRFDRESPTGTDAEVARDIADVDRLIPLYAVETVRMILLIAWKAISDAVSNAWNGIRTFIENAWDGIINFFKTLPDKLFAIGKQIIEGLWNGIKSMFDQIGQGISDFFQNTINDAKKTLGIQSPSTLFAEIGVNLMAGLALGIKRSAMLPQEQLAAATADLSADATLHMQTLLDSSRSGSRQSSAGQPGGTGATIINNNYITDSLSARIILEQQRQDLLRSTREAY